MGYLSGYIAQDIADRHGKCGRNSKGIYWEYAGIRYYFRDENARRWYAKAVVDGTLEDLHPYSHALSQEKI